MTEKGFFGYMDMNVVNPAATDHVLQIVPRFYPGSDVVVKLYDKVTEEETEATVTPLILDGYLYVTLEKAFKDGDDYRITIEAENEVVYMGKIFATSQYLDTQNYKISNGLFTYGQD